jgi:hypothetical protein
MRKAEIEFQCCYCDKGIDPGDKRALRISVMRLYSTDDEGLQEIFAHSECAAERFVPALSSKVPVDPDVFKAGD